MSVTEVRAFREAKKGTSADEDAAFVLDYYIDAESHDSDEQHLRIVIATRILLHYLLKSEMVQIYATYELTCNVTP